MYQLNLEDKNLYVSLENDLTLLKEEAPEWHNTHLNEPTLAPYVSDGVNGANGDNGANGVNGVNGVDEVNEENVNTYKQPAQSAQSAQSAQPMPMKRKRSVWGFIKFALIVVLFALIVYFAIYRIGWGISECAKRNYHDCAALLTPELSALALTSLAL